MSLSQSRLPSLKDELEAQAAALKAELEAELNGVEKASKRAAKGKVPKRVD
jgi:hypothetical protein